jgi:UDP-N-acetylmuramate dehydrogenase
VNVASFEREVADAIGPNRLIADVSLAPFTTFQVGGDADWFVEVRTTDELVRVSGAARAAGVPVTILGGGSNVLVGDKGVRGVVVRPRLSTISQPADDVVRAEAGVTVNGLVRWTIGRGLAGIETWAGTPGTVGGAVYGNAHFMGRNIGDLISRVAVLSGDGAVHELAQADMAFAYDTSRLKQSAEILVWAEIFVFPGDPELLRAAARASLAHRKRTQPLESPSAGCVFQNPDPSYDTLPEDVPASAGALIDRCGLKGQQVGRAQISERHANFFVNLGGATAAEIRDLIELARRTVRDRFGIELEEEIVRMGEF